MTLAEGRALENLRRGTIKRRQRVHLKRWKMTVAALHPDKDTINIDLAVYGAIGLINSAARWPPLPRSRPDFERRLTSGAYLIIDTLIKSDPSEDNIREDEGTLLTRRRGCLLTAESMSWQLDARFVETLHRTRRNAQSDSPRQRFDSLRSGMRRWMGFRTLGKPGRNDFCSRF